MNLSTLTNEEKAAMEEVEWEEKWTESPYKGQNLGEIE